MSARAADIVVDPELAASAPPAIRRAWLAHVLYVAAGILLGVVFVKSEVLSWYRIQEMFRFQSFHMYGVIGSALAVAFVGLQTLRAAGVRALDGTSIALGPKRMTAHGVRYWLGGGVFGLGWGLLGACPGPIFALIGAGVPTMVVALGSAMVGTLLYGAVQSRLPH